ncbi:MAG: arylamine N-acetyltransferase [Gemmatimonadales bacterium]
MTLDLRDRVLGQLGLSKAPAADLDGLRAVYAAWCESVNFDNVAKLVALTTAPREALPGIDASEFFERWLAHGVGGTCWTSSNALFELIASLGFDARRIAGSMRDTGIVSHGSVKVALDGIDWLVDSSMLTRVPLPLTDSLFTSDEPVFSAEVEYVDGTHVVWTDLPPSPTYMPCRLLVDPATHAFYVERWEGSRDRSPFNQRLYALRNVGADRLVLSGPRRIHKTPAGTKTDELNASQVSESLREEFGMSGAILERFRESGALAASLEPVSGPPPAPITRKRPSQRNC